MKMFEIKDDLKDVDRALYKLGLEQHTKKFRKKVLRKLGMEGRKIARRSLKAAIGGKGRTGELYKSIGYKLTKKNYMVISPKGGYNLMKANVLESGATIRAKEADYLTFQVNNKWVKTKVAYIKPRNWFYQNVENHIRSKKATEAVNKVLDREIKKIFEKELKK